MRILVFKSIAVVLALFGAVLMIEVAPVYAKSLNHLGPSDGFSLDETDLVNLFTLETRKRGTLQDAIALVQKIDDSSSSSCNRLAAHHLLTSCADLEPSSSGGASSELVDHVKDLYAMRLALCELESAGATIPSCSGILKITLTDLEEDERPSWSGILKFGRKSSLQSKALQPCLAALEKRPTAWVSYSNNRAQAVTMCQGIRDTLEKTETLKMYRSLVEVVSKTEDTASKILLDLLAAREQVEVDQSRYRAALTLFSSDLDGLLDSVQQRYNDIQEAGSKFFVELSQAGNTTKILNTGLGNALSLSNLNQKANVRNQQQTLEAHAELASRMTNLGDGLGEIELKVLNIFDRMQLLQDVFLAITGGWQLVAGYCFLAFLLVICSVLMWLLKTIRWNLFVATLVLFGTYVFSSQIEDNIRSAYAKCEETVLFACAKGEAATRYIYAKCDGIIAAADEWMTFHYDLTMQILRLTCVSLVVVVLAILGFVGLRQLRFLAQEELDRRSKRKLEAEEKEKLTERQCRTLAGSDRRTRLFAGLDTAEGKIFSIPQNLRASSEPVRSKPPISTLFTKNFPEKTSTPKEALYADLSNLSVMGTLR